jgi:uncharacterized protein (TIGR00730 family)
MSTNNSSIPLEQQREMRICVFCGSSAGNNQLYADAARETGTTLARRRITLIYGGGRVGLMGVLADAALSAGGKVIGVIPESLLQREIQHTGLSELQVVSTMHAQNQDGRVGRRIYCFAWRGRNFRRDL